MQKIFPDNCLCIFLMLVGAPLCVHIYVIVPRCIGPTLKQESHEGNNYAPEPFNSESQ